MVHGNKKLSTGEKFWEKVEIPESANPYLNALARDDCWEWTAYRNKKGYGQFGFRGTSTHAHRVAWTLVNGEIPEDMCVLHHCDNPPCCNPDHLFLGTNTDNNADRHAKGRSGTTMGQSGEKNAMAKLTQKKVDRIRLWCTMPKVTQAMVADAFDISFQQVSRIVRNERWTQ